MCFKFNSSSILDFKSGYSLKCVLLDFLLFEIFTCHKNIYYTILHNHFNYFQIQCWVGPNLVDLSTMVTFWMFYCVGPTIYRNNVHEQNVLSCEECKNAHFKNKQY